MESKGFDSDSKIVIVRNFFTESEANIYVARLKEAGIPSFVSNAHTGTMLPMGGGSISLHVREKDLNEAAAIIREMEYMNQHPEEESFHDADYDDIMYQKRLAQLEHGKVTDKYLFFAIIIIIAILIVSIFNYFGHQMRIW